jgi:hypothetical protein
MRLENEQINNYEKWRAVSEIPLSFDSETSIDGVANAKLKQQLEEVIETYRKRAVLFTESEPFSLCLLTIRKAVAVHHIICNLDHLDRRPVFT